MVKIMKEAVSAKRVLIQIVDKVDDVTLALFTDNPFVNFLNKYYGGGLDSFVDLGFDETDSTTGLTLSEQFGGRLDHVADDFTLTFAKVSSEKKTRLGTADANGKTNSYLNIEDPDLVSTSVTLGGMPTDLEKLFMTKTGTVDTDWTRYNGSSRPSRFGLLVAVIDNPEAPTTADNISMVHFINNVTVVDAGDIKGTGGGDVVRTLNFEADAGDHYMEAVDAQNTNAVINVSQ